MKTSKAEKCWADNHKHNILRLFDVWLKYFLPQLKENKIVSNTWTRFFL